MPIDPDKAVEIAIKYGLDLSDARALASLARHEIDAERYAEKFAAADVSTANEFARWAEQQLNATPQQRVLGEGDPK